jgi:hypothetical protein
METNAGGDDKLGFIRRDMYNHVAHQKKEKIDGSDAKYFLSYMKAQTTKDPDFFLDTPKTNKAICRTYSGLIHNLGWTMLPSVVS